MTEGYEALRAQATGTVSGASRGLALFMSSGLAAWMTVWRRLVGATSKPPALANRIELSATTSHLAPELAVVLAEMALSAQRRNPS